MTPAKKPPAPVPFTYGHQYHDCVRFIEGREYNGSRPIASFPVYDQATIDGLLAYISELEKTSSPHFDAIAKLEATGSDEK